MRWANARIFRVVRRAEESSKEVGRMKRRLVSICGRSLLEVGLVIVSVGRNCTRKYGV